MKLRKKLVAVLAASMVVTSVPVVTMADTTNYVSSARYAKKGTTYGYKVSGNQTLGATGKNVYTDFNGFEFSPIMNYSQPGTMFMSLTQDTDFNAQAILTYVDSFNASTTNGTAQTGLYVDDNEIIHGANTQAWNGYSVEDVIKAGVTLSLNAAAKPAKNTLNRVELEAKVVEAIETSMTARASVSHYEVAEALVGQVVATIQSQLNAGKTIDDIDVDNVVTKAIEVIEDKFEGLEITTTAQAVAVATRGIVDGSVQATLVSAIKAQFADFEEATATITIKEVQSFDVKDADARVYDSHLRVDFSGEFNKDKTYKVPLVAKVGGDKVVLLNIDGKDSFVTSGRYNLTQDAVSDKRVTVTADSNVIRTNYTEEVGTIKLTETAINSLASNGANRQIKITLPSSSDLEFNLTKTASNLTATGKRAFYGEKPEILAVEYGVEEYRNSTEKDRQTLIITLPNWSDATAKGEIELTGIFVQPADREAAVGDVNVTISEYIAKDAKTSNLVASTTVKVAEVKDYDVSISCETPAEIKAGRSGIINEKSATFVLEESVKDSLVDGRKIEFVLENGYIFGPADVEVKTTTSSAVSTTSKEYREAALNTFKKLVANDDIKFQLFDAKANKYVKVSSKVDLEALQLTYDADGRVIGFVTTYDMLDEEVADKLKVTIPVATDVMSSGEVKVVAKNLYTRSYQDAQEDPSCVIAKIAAPIEVSFDGAKLKVGLQAQEAGSITIKETDKGMLEKGWLFLTADIASGITFDKVPTVTVEDASGKEVKVTNVSLNKAGTVLGLEITKTSTEAATIKVSDIVLTADRTVPEANYDLVMWGSALTDENELSISSFKENGRYLDQASDLYTVKEFVQMTTKNTEDITDTASKTTTTSFVIGQSTFVVNGEEVKMDAAPYIKDNYTFVPVKYVAQAFGIAGNAVQYDKATSTATIIAGNKVINITHGKSYIVVNGTQVPMAAKAEVVNGRMCVPMAYIAAALGVEKSWDATTKTATFTNEAK